MEFTISSVLKVGCECISILIFSSFEFCFSIVDDNGDGVDDEFDDDCGVDDEFDDDCGVDDEFDDDEFDEFNNFIPS